MRPLDTPRLHLRPMAEGDFAPFAAYLQDASLCRMYGLPIGAPEEVIRQIFNAFRRDDKTYALIHRASGCMAGHLMVVPSEAPPLLAASLAGQRGVTLAFATAPAYQRQGLMREALAAVIDDLFTNQHMDYIHCACFDFNAASANLQRALGFVRLGSHGARYPDGERSITDRILRPADQPE